MARQTKQEKTTITKAEKKDAVKALFRELLQDKPYKRTALIDETAALYAQRFPDKDTENVNDVKGRVGSVFDIMKKDGEIVLDGGMYALKSQKEEPAPIEEPEKNPPQKVVKKKTEEKETKRSMKRTTAKKGDKKEEGEPIVPILPMMPVNPNYPTDPLAPVILPILPETPEKEKEDKEKATVKKRGRKPKTQTEAVKTEAVEIVAAAEEAPAPKKRGRKPKAETVAKTVQEPVKEEKQEAVAIAQEALAAVKEKTEEIKTQTADEAPAQKTDKTEKAAQKTPAEAAAPVFDMTLLLGEKKGGKVKEQPAPKKEQEKQEKQEKQATVSETKQETPTEKAVKTQEKPPVQKTVNEPKKPTQAAEKKPINKNVKIIKLNKSQTADELLKERYLKRLRSLGGDYFEYYSVYLLERYSMKNGRRLESLRICGGERDGGIDGEIELTDKLGFRETIYIQSKNWNPDKGDEKVWVVGETLLQQFIGACVCRQTKDGKQHCRGIFMTTSRFTPEAKRLLEQMSDKIVGYDGNDLYEAAKECSFGLVQKNGEWTLDEKLLSGEKAFFSLY